MTENIYIQSAKGGAGATTVAAGTGMALAEAGERVCIVDGDSVCADGLYVCGLSGMNVYTLADAANGACRVKQALTEHRQNSNLYLLPTLGCRDGAFISRAVKSLDGLFDYVICDGCAMEACTRAIVVTEPYPPSLKGADERIARISDAGIRDVSVIVNKVNGGLIYDGKILTPQEAASLLRTTLCAVIPEDLTLPLGRMKNSTRRAFAMCAAKLAGRGDRIFSVTGQFTGPCGTLKRYLRRAL